MMDERHQRKMATTDEFLYEILCDAIADDLIFQPQKKEAFIRLCVRLNRFDMIDEYYSQREQTRNDLRELG